VTAQQSRPESCVGKYYERQSLSQCIKYTKSTHILSMLFPLQCCSLSCRKKKKMVSD